MTISTITEVLAALGIYFGTIAAAFLLGFLLLWLVSGE